MSAESRHFPVPLFQTFRMPLTQVGPHGGHSTSYYATRMRMLFSHPTQLPLAYILHRILYEINILFSAYTYSTDYHHSTTALVL